MTRRILALMLACGAPAAAQCVPGWSALGAGCSWEVMSLEADPYMPPGQTRLLVGGYFGAAGGMAAHSMAAWDGRAWSTPLGTLSEPGALFDDGLIVPPGSGPLQAGYYVGGEFDVVAGVSAHRAARWNGAAWHALGAGATEFVLRLGYYDDGGGAPGARALYLGGAFAQFQGQPANSLLRWDGATWAPLTPMLNKPNNDPTGRPTVSALCVFDDDAAGPRRPGLYVGGWHKGAGAVESRNIIRWDGGQWEALESGLNDTVYSMCAFDDDGAGPRPPALFVSGSFNRIVHTGLSANRFARWDGQAWSAPPPLNSNARDMLVWDDDGPGPRPPALFAAGFLGGGVARWRGDGFGWEMGFAGGLGAGVGATYGLSLGIWDEDGPGPNPGGLYVGGNFREAGGVSAWHIARWGCPLPPGGPCYPDCNGDGTLNLSDFGCFTTKFATAQAYADCNGDGARNLSDFGCFTTKFALGCP